MQSRLNDLVNAYFQALAFSKGSTASLQIPIAASDALQGFVRLMFQELEATKGCDSAIAVSVAQMAVVVLKNFMVKTKDLVRQF